VGAAGREELEWEGRRTAVDELPASFSFRWKTVEGLRELLPKEGLWDPPTKKRHRDEKRRVSFVGTGSGG